MIVIKIEENHEELSKFLKDGICNFNFPYYFEVPKGEREVSKRARILLLAGLEALRKEFAHNKKEVFNNSHTSNNDGEINKELKSWI